MEILTGTENIIDGIISILLDSIKSKLSNKHDEKQILSEMREYAIRQFSIVFEHADLTNEIDFIGLLEYINQNLMDKIKLYLFSSDIEKIPQYQEMIIAEATTYASADDKAKYQVVEKFVCDILSIARQYYVDKLDGKYKLFINITAQSILSNITNTLENQLNQLPQKTASELIDTLSQGGYRIDKIGGVLTKAPPIVDDTFIHRENVIDELLTKIEVDKKLLLVSGFGGIGKTSIARALFHRLKGKYQYAAWIDYNNCLEESVLSSFLLYEDVQDQNNRFSSIMNFLREIADLAVIFIDNVTNDIPEDPLLGEFAGLGAKVIITSRISRINYYRTYRIEFLKPEECVDLFYTYYSYGEDRKEESSVCKIVELVSYHTLSIELLAKGIVPGISIQEYYDKLIEIGFGFPNLLVNTEHTETMMTISDHLKKLFDMACLSNEQKRILDNFALMPSIEIPAQIIEWIECDINDIMSLVKTGWLSASANSYFMHPVVKETIGLYEVHQESLDKFLKCVAENRFFHETENYLLVRKKVHIIETVLENATVLDNEIFVIVVFNLAGVYGDQGEYGKALELYGKALKIQEEVLGEAHPSTAATYHNLAGVYEAQGEYGKALELYGKAQKIKEEVLGEAHPSTATTYHNLAGVYKAQGEYGKALELYGKVLKIEKEVLGEAHPSTAATYHNLAGVYEAQGEYGKALELYGKVLKIDKDILGEAHPSTATTYHNLAGVYKAQGEYGKALELYGKVLKIDKDILGEAHPSTATTYHNLAEVYKAQGKYGKALELYGKALKIQEEVLGEAHPSTAATYHNLAGVYKAQGEYGKALELYGKVLKIDKDILGEAHPSTATTYHNLAGVYKAQGEYGKALELYGKALKIQEEVLGEAHPSTAATYHNLAGVYKAQGEYGKALELYGKAQKIKEEVLGEAHPSTAATYHNLAGVYEAQGKYGKALELYGKSQKIQEEVLGEAHPSTATTYHNLAGVYGAQGEYGKALELYGKALKIQEEVLGEAHLSTAATYHNLAGVYKAQGEYGKALELYGKAQKIKEEVLGETHLSTATTYHNLAGVYKAQGEYGKALELYVLAYRTFINKLRINHPHISIVYENMALCYSQCPDIKQNFSEWLENNL